MPALRIKLILSFSHELKGPSQQCGGLFSIAEPCLRFAAEALKRFAAEPSSVPARSDAYMGIYCGQMPVVMI